MKKIIMILTAVAMLATSAIGVSAVDYTAGEDGKYTGVAYEGLTANEYYGVVVVAGTENATVDFSNTDNILYIDQVTADANGNITIPAFMTKGDELVEGTIFIGGAGLDTATNIGYLKLAAGEDPETFIISGTVSGYAGAILPTVKVSDGTNEYTAEYTLDEENKATPNFTVTVPVLESGAYTLTATKTSHLSYTKNSVTGTKDATTTVNPVLIVGNVNADEAISISDIALIAGIYEKTGADDEFVTEYDVNEDSSISISDVALAAGNYEAIPVVE